MSNPDHPGYSLRDAARTLGVQEERLRRAILMGELPAEPVPDDRQYLIRASDLGIRVPSRRGRATRVLAWSILTVIVLWVVSLGFDTTWDAYCSDCGVLRNRLLFATLPLPCTWTESGAGTGLIRASYPGPCRHEWRPVEVDRHG